LAKTLFQKIAGSHLREGALEPGRVVGLRIDQTLTQDATGTMAWLQFETLGLDRVKNDLAVSYVDHNTLQQGPENADDHRYLESVARKFGAYFSRPGNGICHQVHLERFSRPGATLLGSDSHTPTCGGAGMLAIGAGGLSVALAMAGRPYSFTCPEVLRIVLKGRLRPWVTAKDIILEILRRRTTRGNSRLVVEYAGDGLAGLSVPERATIANMGAELGVLSSLFPSDDATLAFLKAQRREQDFSPVEADPDATYAETLEVDLAALEPLAACPHRPDNVRPVRELAGTRIDQVCIGSCTNSSFKDLTRVARILKGRRLPGHLSLVVVPGSRQVLEMITASGALATFVAAGARLVEPSCSFCIGSGHSPPSGGGSVRTSNRNFKGRCGTEDAGVYIVSPEVATASAIVGTIADPRTLGIELPDAAMPTEFTTDDSMILPPAPAGTRVEIIRGPNIGEPPRPTLLPEDFTAEVMLRLGDNVTTDTIMPAGQRLKYRSNIKKYSSYVFEPADPTFPARCLENKPRGIVNVVVAGLSYGQGSSREHAAICPEYLGVKLVVAKSFERIHRQNLVNSGIVPLTFANLDDYDRVKQGDRLRVRQARRQLERGERITIASESGEYEIELVSDLSESERATVLAGGLLNAIRLAEAR
jgi:aconitate hydratase